MFVKIFFQVSANEGMGESSKLVEFSSQKLFKFLLAVIIVCEKQNILMSTKTMSTYSQANTLIGQSECTYYFSYFINSCVINISMMTFQLIVNP